MNRYLILGNGAAGVEAAASIRKIDSASPITIVSESRRLHYFRPKLVHYLAETGASADLAVYGEDWYRERSIANILGRRATALDLAGRTVRDHTGAVHEWDKLLVATGGRAWLPPVPGVERRGVFTLRSQSDADAIKAYCAGASAVAVVGGGLLGLENAYSLAQTGAAVTVVETAPWLLPRQLDAEGGRHLQTLLEAKGLRFAVGDQLSSIEGEGPDGPVSSVVLASGGRLACGAVLVSAGVRADVDFLRGGPVAVERGVVVDDFLRSSAPDVWAAGDAAQHRGVCYGLWTVAREQGRIAGLNMAGVPTAYAGSLPTSLLKITGINVFSAGEVGGAGAADESIAFRSPELYRKLVLDSGGKPRAAMVVGDKAAIQLAQKIMSGKASVDEFRRLAT